MINTATDKQRQQFAQDGYVVVRHAVDPIQVQAAVDAVNNILDRAEQGGFGDDFRWTDSEQRVPAFASDFLSAGKYYPAFGELLANVMLPFTESLLGKPVRCSWLLMLTAGAGQPYSVPLHRDNCELGGADESRLLNLYSMNQCYFQAPLLADDKFLQVIPGSHLRKATETEIAVARSNVPDIEVPRLETIELQPGDVIYRNTNLIHQGWNPGGVSRWTLVSGFWAADLPMQDIEKQDFELINTPGFVDRLPPYCQEAVNRYFQSYELDT